MGGFMDSKEASIIREFCHLSIGELRLEIHDAIEKFVVLTKSEEEATRILEKYGKQAYFDFNDWKKIRYYKLMEVAKLKNLVIPNEWYNVDFTNDDVIVRIKEIMYDDIKWINEYCYLHDYGFYEDGVLEENENIDGKSEFINLPSDIEIDKVITFYNDIIEKEFGDRKKLVK